MNPNVEKLRDLKRALERVERDHRDILQRDAMISAPMHQTLIAVDTRWKAVEDHALHQPPPQAWD